MIRTAAAGGVTMPVARIACDPPGLPRAGSGGGAAQTPSLAAALLVLAAFGAYLTLVQRGRRQRDGDR